MGFSAVRAARLTAGMLVFVALSCSSDDGAQKPKKEYPKPGPGELCLDPDSSFVDLYVTPKRVVLAPGQTREVDVVVVPDICVPERVTFASADSAVVAAPAAQTVDLETPRLTLKLTGKAAGSTTVTATIPKGDGSDATTTLEVEVLDPALPVCSGSNSGTVDDGGSVELSGASIGLQAGATSPNENSYLWSVGPFSVDIACAEDQVPSGYLALGPAVRFSPDDKQLPREIPFALPVNPAALPEAARMRHVTVAYSGPRAKTPRIVPVSNPRIEKRADGGYSLTFLAPWLGTYQAVVREDGGTVTRKRRLTHRAVIGVSMGGGGAAMFGLRFHHEFDTIVPLGGPVDWTWMLGHIERNHLGGFLPNDGTTPPASLAPMPEPTLPYEHPSTFNRWWYEYPKAGNGGSFPRSEYVQIFRDLALMFGNPNSYNPTPGAENLPAGIAPDDKTVVGDHPGRQCAVWVDPIDGHPDEENQKTLNNECPVERCQYTTTLNNYYDDEFNPLGTFPVITVCDGSPQQQDLTPWANTWSDQNNDKPLELALAVDYNANGKRDENEPILRQGYERYQDTGSDGVPSAQEPGYAAGTNEDPAGDDWHPQFNPTGSEGNYRWDEGEPYDDFGLDGVQNTQSSPYDFGEGNGKFDYSPGAMTFLERDARTVIEQHPWGTHAEPLDDEALARVDLWTDGGTRDLFNFAVDAQALIGGYAGRGRVTHYYHGFQYVPGQDPASAKEFIPGRIDWADVPGSVLMRYGKIDPTQKDFDTGSGQHVGTVDEIIGRLQVGFYFIGSRWPDAPRTYDDYAGLEPNPDLELCEVDGTCDFDFVDTRGREGPVSVVLPPGYGHIGNKDKRYPVIYLLHGYGQTPQELKASALFVDNWMNFAGDSKATRLPKAIVVFVDGRCRPGKDEAECIRGTFYTDSVRAAGPKMEGWFRELLDEIDSRYRTLPETEVDWTE